MNNTSSPKFAESQPVIPMMRPELSVTGRRDSKASGCLSFTRIAILGHTISSAARRCLPSGNY